MPEVPSPDWLSWAFWAQDHESIRDLVITIAALVGIPFLGWREWLHHRQTKAALQPAEVARQQAATAQLRHEEQVKADRERRITDNFTRAAELLGSRQLTTRLGAIYTLERIARESETDHWPIMETLTAHVRERAPWPPIRESAKRPATDVQAIFTVIGRQRREYEDEHQMLDLSGTDLRRYDLRGAHLERADFDDAHLEGAGLWDAHLEGATFYGTHLTMARLGGAHLKRAEFFETHLEGAWLRGSDITQEQLDGVFTDENTSLPDHIKRPDKLASEPAETQREVDNG